MNPEELQSHVASGRLTQVQVNKLGNLSPGSFCLHRSWGFGKIDSIDPILGQIIINFQQKQKHPMQLAYAADSLTPIGADNILALKASDPASLKTMAGQDPSELVKLFVKSFGESSTVDKLETTLCPEVMSQTDFKKWQSSAKRAFKKEGLIIWPAKKNEPFKVLEKPETPTDVIRARLAQIRSFEELLTVAEDTLKKIAKSADLKPVIPDVVKLLDDYISSSRDRNPSIMIEAIWIRDDLVRFSGSGAAAVGIESLIQEVHNVHELVSDLSAHRQKHILPVIKKSFPDWEQRIKAMVPSAGGKLLTEIVDFLVVEGKESELASVFERSLHEHRAGADLMIWLCKNRDEPSYAKWLPPLINGRLLSVILQQLEAMALENNGIRKNSLTELLLNDTTVIADLVRSCDAEETRDLGKSVLMNPAIEELDKRSLMARLIKVSPSVQSLLVSNQHTQTEALVVSWESLERRKQEYDEIINKKIPENTKEIAIARSYGDLRENHEFKAAKEMQTVLMRQKAELEQMLSRARGTDFYKPDVTAVNIGTRVTIEPLDGGSEASYTILGAWDSDPDKGIISYQTATAAVMLGHKIGEQVNLPGEQGERSVRITKIEAAFPEGAAQPFDSVQPGDASSLQEASSPNAEVGGSNANA